MAIKLVIASLLLQKTLQKWIRTAQSVFQKKISIFDLLFMK